MVKNKKKIYPRYKRFKKDEKLNEIDNIKKELQKINTNFEEKLFYDNHKEKQIDKLHSELQEYKNDLLHKMNRPFIIGLIYMYDDIDKTIERVSQNDMIETEKVLKILKGIKEDIEILLEENGIMKFSEVLSENSKFNPSRQQVIKKSLTEDESKEGLVKQSIRSGFESDIKVVRKEKVEVYILQKNKGEK